MLKNYGWFVRILAPLIFNYWYFKDHCSAYFAAFSFENIFLVPIGYSKKIINRQKTAATICLQIFSNIKARFYENFNITMNLLPVYHKLFTHYLYSSQYVLWQNSKGHDHLMSWNFYYVSILNVHTVLPRLIFILTDS